MHVDGHSHTDERGFRPFLQRWQGVVLTLVTCVVTVMLGFSGQLGLYIHPRYFVFTIVLAVVALVFVLGSLIWRGHVHDDGGDKRGATLVSILGVAVIGSLVTAMVVIPPASLSASSAAQRSMAGESTPITLENDVTTDLVSTGAIDRLSLGDWAALIARQSDPGYFAGMTATMSGFVMPYGEGVDDVFLLSRFKVTCCTVDAQPVGVPVRLDGWAERYAVDGWVEATVRFVAAPDELGTGVILEPTEIAAIDEPADPYEY